MQNASAKSSNNSGLLECAWEPQASLRGAARFPTFPGAGSAGLLSNAPLGR